jgi:lipopolysaccharide/colanic/teichoic acid biosynthesis glycosyltransferase
MTRRRALAYWILAVDLIYACLAMAVAVLLRYGLGWDAPLLSHAVRTHGVQLLLALILWTLLSVWMELDGFSRGFWLPAVISQVCLAVGTLMVLLLASDYLARDYVSRLVLIYFAVLLIPGLVGIRYSVQRFFLSRYLYGHVRRVVILGSDRVATELAKRIERHPELLCQVVGFLYPHDQAHSNSSMDASQRTCNVQTLEIVDLLRGYGVDELVLVDTDPARGEVLNLAARCRSLGIEVSLVPHLYELYLSRPDMVDLGGVPLLRLREPKVSGPSRAVKRVVDLALGSFLLILASPVIVVAGIIVRLAHGQAFRRELRCGQNGKSFWMYRLNVNRLPDGLTSREQFLHKLSISELPNLWNVLRGEMSLVGPRPESFDRAQHYSDWTRQRLNVKPGITGLAQVHGLRDQHSSDAKARFDLQYSLDQSLFGDLSLILQTVWTLCARITRPAPTPPDLVESFHPLETFSSVNSSQSSAD